MVELWSGEDHIPPHAMVFGTPTSQVFKRVATRVESNYSVSVTKHPYRGSEVHSTGTKQDIHGGLFGTEMRDEEVLVDGDEGQRYETRSREVKVLVGKANLEVTSSQRSGGKTDLGYYPPELPEGEFWVHSHQTHAFQKKVDKLARKAEKLGYDPLRAVEVGKTHRHEFDRFLPNGKPEEDFGRVDLWTAYKLEGEPPLIPGYEFVARIEHVKGDATTDGKDVNMLKANPTYEGEIPKKYRTAGPNCDRCKRNIYRKDTFIVRNTETGEFVQLGREDLKAYTGNDDILNASKYISAYAGFGTDFSDPDDDLGGGPREGRFYSPRAFVAASVAAIEERGRYVKTSEWDEQSTKARVLDHFEGKPYTRGGVTYDPRLEITERHLERADQIIEWAEDTIDEDTTSDYLWNLRVALTTSGGMDSRMLGIAASAPAAYSRAVERGYGTEPVAKPEPTFTSEWFGEPKKRIKGMELTVTRTHSFEGHYGTTFIYNFRDDAGNAAVWFSSNPLGMESYDDKGYYSFDPVEVGHKIKLDATVKSHDIDTFKDRNEKQTVLTRGKFHGWVERDVELINGIPAHLMSVPA